MDIVSHGLWGAIALGRASRKSFWTAFAFGVAPDLFSFGPLFANGLLLHGLEFLNSLGRRPDPSLIPAYVHGLYNMTHSLVVFAAAFALVWLVRRKPLMAMGAWGLHIAMDIFTHANNFFPTPFLWPISDARFNGVPWGEPIVFFSNLLLLALLYAWFFFMKKNRR